MGLRIDIGDKVYIPDEKRPYTVQCRDDRYIICTKPFNLRHTVQYFIIDLVDKWRAPDDRVFCFGYETTKQCLDRLRELQSGKVHLSQRRGVPLDVEVE